MNWPVLPVALLLILPGCSKKAPALQQPVGTVQGTIYFPLVAGSKITFKGGTGIGTNEVDPDNPSFTVAVARMSDGKPGFTIDRDGRGIINAITMFYTKTAEGIVTYSGMFGVSKTEFNPPFVELPTAITAHARWSWKSSINAMTVDSEVLGYETITVPAGSFKCLKIHRSFGGMGSLDQWYAENKGIIKVDMINSGGRVYLERSN